jgi:hypothetical protein
MGTLLEMALVTGHRGRGDVYAFGYCQLLVLKRKDFQELLASDLRIKMHIDEVAMNVFS